MESKTYKIPAQNIERLTGEIAALGRHAKRIRAKGFDCADVGIETIEIVSEWKYTDSDGNIWPTKTVEAIIARDGKAAIDSMVKREFFYHIVRVTGTRPTIGGWVFAATLQREDGGVIIRARYDRKTPA
jgi:hypothetical protein